MEVQTHMKTRRAVTVGAASLLMVGAASGIAMAANNPTPSAPSTTQSQSAESTSTVDTGTLQQGDQTTPDTTAEKAGTEAAGSEQAGTEKASAEADGPGGHADANGQNVDHQFDGQE